jgi:hypothetical protein
MRSSARGTPSCRDSACFSLHHSSSGHVITPSTADYAPQRAPGAIDHGLQVLVGFTGSVRVSNALSSAGGLDRAESGHAWDWPDRTLAGCWCTATRATGPARPLGLQSGAWQVLEVADAPQFHEWKL